MSSADSAVLVTGGAGFIGSHMCAALSEAGIDVVVLDDFSNSDRSVIDRLGKIMGRLPGVVEGNVMDGPLLDRLFRERSIAAVLHFAAFKAVGESVQKPIDYYRNNVAGTLSLLQAMQRAGVKTFVFSSSATVYGADAPVPYTEKTALGPFNPYGWTKRMVEQILTDQCLADPQWRVACLRYFNPVGAHSSGLIGESPSGVPNNLMPYIAQVASGQRPFLQVFGGDYPTPDGTGVRDYIHVMDLAEGHLAALRHLESHEGLLTLNLGTGQGVSVLEMAKAFEAVSGRAIACKIVGRRAGDLAAYWADAEEAARLLGWRARRGALEMCTDVWRWQQYAATL
jgi:UDP-glucose 4-epimerase